jgi:hypothetical protein
MCQTVATGSMNVNNAPTPSTSLHGIRLCRCRVADGCAHFGPPQADSQTSVFAGRPATTGQAREARLPDEASSRRREDLHTHAVEREKPAGGPESPPRLRLVRRSVCAKCGKKCAHPTARTKRSPTEPTCAQHLSGALILRQGADSLAGTARQGCRRPT